MESSFNLDKPFFTGQYCECGGEIWSQCIGYACIKCKTNTTVHPETNLHIKFDKQEIDGGKK